LQVHTLTREEKKPRAQPEEKPREFSLRRSQESPARGASQNPNLERSRKLKTGRSVEEVNLVNLFECSLSLL